MAINLLNHGRDHDSPTRQHERADERRRQIEHEKYSSVVGAAGEPTEKPKWLATAAATLAAQQPRIGNYLNRLVFNPRAESSDNPLK
jgi:hypothetical protein